MPVRTRTRQNASERAQNAHINCSTEVELQIGYYKINVHTLPLLLVLDDGATTLLQVFFAGILVGCTTFLAFLFLAGFLAGTWMISGTDVSCVGVGARLLPVAEATKSYC